jgi:hypothetical protein
MTILAGVRSGERIAANGAFKLREGVLVNAASTDEGLAADAPTGGPVGGPVSDPRHAQVGK